MPREYSALHASGRCLKGHKHKTPEAAELCDFKDKVKRDKLRERQQSANEGYM